MAFNTFKYTDYTYTPKHNLEQIASTYDYLQQRHDAAVTQESALKKAIGDLQLNAEEDEFKQQLLNSTKAAIDTAMIGDFKGYALNKIIEEQGNLLSNPAVIGRLRSQQAYKAYQDQLDKRTDISEDKKNYFREINHYYHTDKTDANGNVIGSEEWKPIRREVSEVPKATIMNQALQWAAKETGNSQQITFLDANGNPTTNYEESADGNIFMSQNGTYQKLSKEKLRKAVNAAINTIAGAKESLRQDYDIALWKDDKNGYNSDVRDKNNQLMSFDEYVNKGFDDAIDAASYYNYTSNIEFGDALKARREAQKVAAQNAANQTNYNITDLLQSNSNLEVVQNTTPSDLTATIANTKQQLQNTLSVDINSKSSSELRTMVNTIKDPVQKYALLNQIDELELAENNLKRIKENIGIEEKKSFDFVNAIESGTTLPNNTVSERANKFIDSLFPSNAAGVELYFNNDNEQQEFLNQIGGIDNLKKLGAEITTINGDTVVYVDRNARNNIYTIGKALKNARNNTSNLLFELSRGLNDAILLRGNKYNVAVRTNDGKRYDPAWQGQRYGQIIPSVSGDYGVHGDGALILNGFVDFVDQQKDITEEALKLNDVPIQTQFIPAATVDEVEARMKLASGIGDVSTLNAQIKNQQDVAANMLSSISLNQQNTRVMDDETGGVFTKTNTEKLMKYDGLLADQSIKKEISVAFDINGEPEFLVTMMDDDKPVRLKIGGVDNSTTRAWKQQTDIKAKSDIIKLVNFDKDIALSNNTSFAGLPKLNIDKNLVLINNETKEAKQLTQSEAAELRNGYLIWTQTANAAIAGIGKQEYITANAVKTAEIYANIVYGTTNQNTINGIAKRLLKNIGL